MLVAMKHKTAERGGTVAAYNDLNDKDCELIMALAENGMKYMVAAQSIDMHPRSAYGRLEKIHKITGLDSRDFYDLQKLIEHIHRKTHVEVTIKPDGVHELPSHSFELEQRLANCTVEILRCKCCGHVSIGWYRQEDTEEIE